VKYLATKIRKMLNIEGYNILQNNFEAAGQVIKHFHVHIIPRKVKDRKFKVEIPREQVNEKDLNRVFEILKE
jgi:histidine triad (HIT) family protein